MERARSNPKSKRAQRRHKNRWLLPWEKRDANYVVLWSGVCTYVVHRMGTVRFQPFVGDPAFDYWDRGWETITHARNQTEGRRAAEKHFQERFPLLALGLLSPKARRNPSMGPPPALRKALTTLAENRIRGGSRDDRYNTVRELVYDTYNEWLLAVGIPQGMARQVGNAFEVTASLDEVLPSLTQVLDALVRSTAARAAAESKDAARADLEEMRALQASMEAPEEEETFAPPLLGELEAGSPNEQARAALIKMHLGLPVVPGQPTAWLTRQVYDRKSGNTKDITPALDDFYAYHGRDATKKGACPTCAQMARFFRVPGLTTADISALMSWYSDAAALTTTWKRKS